MIHFINSKDSGAGESDLAKRLVSLLREGKKTIWLLPGGSNIPISIRVLDTVKQAVTIAELKKLSIMQADERYGPVGHPDSNWFQLKEQGFATDNVENWPILQGLSIEDTANEYSKVVEERFAFADVIIGQFGLGADGHIAGLLPNTEGFKSKSAVCGYKEGGAFQRISLTIPSLLKIAEAFVFVFGESKREAIDRLRMKDENIENLPASVLKKIPEVYFFSDQV
jgi:6-phosphogluconolactonase/glucosamine-6-phosphate isomerase/deaminase